MIGIAFFVAALTVSACLAIGWYGSNKVFHPSKRLPNVVWPEQFGMSYERVEFATPDGLSLKGWLIPAARPTNQTILLCHGWGDNKGDLLSCTSFLQHHFNLFFFDFRHHGESQRHISSIGYLETIDLNSAIDFLKRTKPDWSAHLGLFGHSMGSSPAVWATAHHPDVKALAIESPINSFNQTVAQFTKNAFNLPYFPFIWSTLKVIRLRLGRDPEPYSPAYQIDRISPRPLLIITGSEDRLTKVSTVQALYDRAKPPKELWVVPGAEHRSRRCIEVAGEEYKTRLSGFYSANL